MVVSTCFESRFLNLESMGLYTPLIHPFVCKELLWEAHYTASSCISFLHVNWCLQSRFDKFLRWACTCIQTDPWSGRARRGKHCALAVVLILFFQRLSASWWRLDCSPGRWCVCGVFCTVASVWGRDDGGVKKPPAGGDVQPLSVSSE